MASGLEVALGAARRLKEQGRDDIAFLLIGDGAVRAELEEQARAEGLDNVVFTGLVPRAELPDYLASSDACLVHFRKQELFSTILPSKFFEDAAMEKPILLGFEGDARALLEEADCGIAFEPGNDAELAAAAVRLADDPARAARGSARTAAATCSSTSTGARSRTTTSRSSSACAPPPARPPMSRRRRAGGPAPAAVPACGRMCRTTAPGGAHEHRRRHDHRRGLLVRDARCATGGSSSASSSSAPSSAASSPWRRPRSTAPPSSVYIGQTTDANGNAMAGLNSNSKAATQLLASQVVLNEAAEAHRHGRHARAGCARRPPS